MSIMVQTTEGFPSIVNVMPHTVDTLQPITYSCNVCGEPAFFHCNACEDYDLCDKHILTEEWHTHGSHGADVSFANKGSCGTVKGV
ncbi:hypothetical protein STCU_11202 [Strigomonas culicis]|uniref:ZZ-type domain-containing protein n=1 Tax=Strigomonas culicis TaxID=28005 RepID=S9V117_9TRYP|nr:hypothetical protein STCU_11202 [Strigomonas culicis]|eukprot:EPY16495.1 hypothetical protein STCU_11202 [Strigomonas culicis]